MRTKRQAKFHGILLTRDDEDILDQCIAHALTWCDHLYIYETGGFDRTWDIVQEWVAKERRVQAFRFEGGQALMESGLRGYVFEHFRDNMNDGDWIAQVDSDEFYHVSPKKFVDEALGPMHSAVGHQLYEFRLLQSEVEKWYRGEESLADRKRPIMERRRSYEILHYTEPRMFKYRSTMQWPPQVAYPYNAGFTARVRIPIRHYPQRDPVQLQKRWALRNILAPDADQAWKHWQHGSWRDLVTSDSKTGLRHWAHGNELPPDPYPPNPIKMGKRAAQMAIYAGLNRVMDRWRPSFPQDFRPQRLSEDTVARIEKVYAAIDASAEAGIPWEWK